MGMRAAVLVAMYLTLDGDTPDHKAVMRVSLIPGYLMTLL